MLVRNYIPKLMELPKLSQCKYEKLHDDLLINEIIYEFKNIKTATEKWIK
jgi:hypothetical protein